MYVRNTYLRVKYENFFNFSYKDKHLNNTSLLKSVDFSEVLTTLDWILFIFVLLCTLASIIYGNLRKKPTLKNNETDSNLLDHLIMGRKLTLPLFVATLVATWYGGIFGVTAIAFNQGIFNFVTQGFFWYCTYIIFAIFLVKKVAAYKAVTLPELVKKMFGPRSAKLAAIFNFFNVLPIAYIISLGLFINLVFGLDLLWSSLLGTLFVCLYSMWGGFRAVVFSDIIQFFFMCLAVVLIIVFSYQTFGGIDFLKANLPARYFSLTGDVGLATTLSWGFIALATLVDPNFYQRCFAALNEKTARKGIFISTLIWIAFDLCTTFGAMYAKATIPDAEPGTAYLTYALQILPNGFRGMVLAGILATILSTLDSYIFLAGTTLTYDLFPKLSKHHLKLHHAGIFIVGLIAFSLSLLFDGNIKKVWKILGSYSSACLLIPMLYGYVFPLKLKDKQFVFVSLIGVAFVTYWEIIERWKLQNTYGVDSLYIGSLITCLSLLVFHLANKKPSSKHQ